MDNAKPNGEANAIAETRNLVTAVKLKGLYLAKQDAEKVLSPILERLNSAQTEKEKVKVLVDAQEECKSRLQYSRAIYDNIVPAMDVLEMAKIDPTISDDLFKAFRIEGEQNINNFLRRTRYASLFGSVFNEWMNFEGKADHPEDNDGVQTPKSDDESTINMSSDMMGRPEKYSQKAELESIIFEPDPKAKPEEYVAFLEGLFKEAEIEAKKALVSLAKGANDDDDDDDDDEDEDMEDVDESDDIDSDDDSEKGPYDEDYDDDYYERYLNDYGTQEITLKKLRNTIGRFSGSMRKHDELGLVDVKQSIHSLVSSELLTETKKAACKEILLSEVILEEIAKVLTLRLQVIENWKYSESSIQLNFRRHLNGKYRCYADEPLLDAIFLQWIGIRWGMEIRRVLGIIYDDHRFWLRPENPIDAARQEVRSKMLSREDEKIAKDSISAHEKTFMKEFFLTLLPESLYDFRTYNEDGEEADQEKKDNEKIHRARNEELKQMLLQRLLIDRQYSEAVNPGKPFTVVQADAYRFAQSQSHEIILALMKFIGATPQWLKFFETFLKLPARIESSDEVRESKRGVPISHPLGLVFGEVQFFFMEFAINRATKGDLQVFRMHDDVWWWSADESKCKLAWDTILKYSALTGTDWNLNKSGCVRISNEPSNPESRTSDKLPQGDISWGFIKLGSDGVWKIKQDELEKHTQELKVQMDAQKSILGLIGAYNRYMKFFVRNFGKPARVFGKQHVEQIIAAINQIHTSLFPSHNGDVLAYIASLIQSRFGEEIAGPMVPAWLLMPVAQGGLGVRNVLFDLYPILKAYNQEEETQKRNKRMGWSGSPQSFSQCLKTDKKNYETAKASWLKNPKPVKVSWEHDISDEWFDGSVDKWVKFQAMAKSSRRGKKPHPFLTFQEYILGRRGKFDHWGTAWKQLSQTPDNISINSTNQIPKRVDKAINDGRAFVPGSDWVKTEFGKPGTYWKTWALGFGEQVLDSFGGFWLTSRTQFPEAMIAIYTNLKTKWDQ